MDGAEEATSEPGVEGSGPTRPAKRTFGEQLPGLGTPSSQRSAPVFELSVEALRNEERGRLRITAQVLIGMACFGLALSPILGGDPFARKVFTGGLIWAVITMGLLLWNSYAGKYNIHLIGAGATGLAAANTCTLYYIGTFSQATMTGAIGLYIFCLGGSVHWAAAVYAALAVPHALLAGLIIAKVIPDLGLVSAETLPMTEQLALHACVQAVYALAFVAGRTSRGKLERVFGELESAARLIAQRDALLNEAKRELERAVWVGGEGRFTEQVVGSFRLGKVIGRGGMGEVYEAFHVETDEEAAVKLLQRNVLADPTNLARFAREVRAVRAIDSPHVVRVLEVPNEDAPVPYLAMERLRGEDLSSMLRRERRLSSRELVALVQQVSRGLDAARAVGVIHRDIKPQNLFLARCEDDVMRWKILDFGVSKLAGENTLTLDQLVGTPDYMAPEQAAGREVDHRADLYGFSAVLYRCVASRAPFMETSLAALVHKVIHEMPPRPSSLARVSSDVEACLAIGLAKDPDERFASGAELAEAFTAAVRNELSPALRARAQQLLQRMPWTDG